MRQPKEISDLISNFNEHHRSKTFAEFIGELLKDKFIELYLGDSFEEIKLEQTSMSYPAVFCGKVVGAFKECIILNSFYSADSKGTKQLGNLIFVNERAIRALKEVDGNGTINDLFIKSGSESLGIYKDFAKKND
jgi:hypothetical protein